MVGLMPIKVFIALIFLTLSGVISYAASDSERIEGVLEFFNERANANYIYTFEKTLGNSKEFKQYFPETYKYASENNLQLLLNSNDIWKETIDRDISYLLNTITNKYVEVFYKEFNENFNLNDIDSYLTLYQNQVVVINGQEYALNSIPIDAPKEVKDKINLFSTPIIEFVEFKKELIESKNIFRTINEKESIKSCEKLLKRINEYNAEKIKNIDLRIEEIRTNSITFKGDKKEILNLYTNMANELKSSSLKIKKLENAFRNSNISEMFSSKKEYSYTYKIVKILGLMKEINEIYTEKIISEEQFESLKKMILFFGRIADADKKEQVKSILNEITLPPVGYYLKHDGKIHGFIGSYYGYSPKNSLGCIVTGEISMKATDNFSITGFISPIDFAYPINRKIKEKIDMELKDIFFTSVGISLGVKDYPISLSVRYCEDNSYNCIIGFDMPLASIF